MPSEMFDPLHELMDKGCFPRPGGCEATWHLLKLVGDQCWFLRTDSYLTPGEITECIRPLDGVDVALYAMYEHSQGLITLMFVPLNEAV